VKHVDALTTPNFSFCRTHDVTHAVRLALYSLLVPP